MFVRVRDFGTTNAALFPESSTGSTLFKQVTTAVAAIEDHLKNHTLATAVARKVKATTRKAVREYMRTIVKAARQVTRPEAGETPFRMPRSSSVKAEIAAARMFIEEAATRQDQFIKLGLPATFISDFTALVDTLQRAATEREDSKTLRAKAQDGMTAAFSTGLAAVRDLEVIVEIATQHDPATLGGWQKASDIEGSSSSASRAAKDPKTAAPATVSALNKAS